MVAVLLCLGLMLTPGTPFGFAKTAPLTQQLGQNTTSEVVVNQETNPENKNTAPSTDAAPVNTTSFLSGSDRGAVSLQSDDPKPQEKRVVLETVDLSSIGKTTGKMEVVKITENGVDKYFIEITMPGNDVKQYEILPKTDQTGNVRYYDSANILWGLYTGGPTMNVPKITIGKRMYFTLAGGNEPGHDQLMIEWYGTPDEQSLAGKYKWVLDTHYSNNLLKERVVVRQTLYGFQSDQIDDPIHHKITEEYLTDTGTNQLALANKTQMIMIPFGSLETALQTLITYYEVKGYSYSGFGWRFYAQRITQSGSRRYTGDRFEITKQRNGQYYFKAYTRGGALNGGVTLQEGTSPEAILYGGTIEESSGLYMDITVTDSQANTLGKFEFEEHLLTRLDTPSVVDPKVRFREIFGRDPIEEELKGIQGMLPAELEKALQNAKRALDELVSRSGMSEAQKNGVRMITTAWNGYTYLILNESDIKKDKNGVVSYPRNFFAMNGKINEGSLPICAALKDLLQKGIKLEDIVTTSGFFPAGANAQGTGEAVLKDGRRLTYLVAKGTLAIQQIREIHGEKITWTYPDGSKTVVVHDNADLRTQKPLSITYQTADGKIVSVDLSKAGMRAGTDNKSAFRDWDWFFQDTLGIEAALKEYLKRPGTGSGETLIAKSFSHQGACVAGASTCTVNVALESLTHVLDYQIKISMSATRNYLYAAILKNEKTR